MTIDPSIVQRLSQSIAAALEEITAPLRDEIEQLRAELEAERSGTPAEAPSGARPAAVRNGRATVIKPAIAPRSTSSSAQPACQVPHCPAAVLAKELCETHYRVMRRTVAAGQRFDPKAQRPAGFRKPAPGCQEPGCKEPHYAKDLCRKHYMAARARLRAEESRTGRKAAGTLATVKRPVAQQQAPAPAALVEETEKEPVEIEWTFPEGTPQTNVAMPTAEVVARVVRQYRGGLTKVADVLGRNRQTLMDLLVQLNLMEEVVSVRANERKRLLAAPLKERLADLLFREKLLEDLGCLKEVDESAKNEVQQRCATIVKSAETQEDALRALGLELGLEEAGLKRLVWRYDLRRQLRGLKSRPTQSVRPRA